MGPLRASIRWQPCIIWLLVAALTVYGCNSALVQVVGPAHRHSPAATSSVSQVTAWAVNAVQAVRTWRTQVLDRLPVTGGLRALQNAHEHASGHAHTHIGDASADRSHAVSAVHAHSHSNFVRHHHDVGDASVVTLDNGADGGAAQAAAGAAMLELALAPSWSVPCPRPVVEAWAAVAPANWSDAATHRIERPPRG